MSLCVAYLALLAAVAAPQAFVSAEWRSWGSHSRVNFSRADLETTYSVYGSHKMLLRAYRLEPFNDSACRQHYGAEANRRCLRWTSLGYPQLTAVIDPVGGQFRSRNGSNVKAFYLTRSDFSFDLAVLTDEQKRRLAYAARMKYGFVPLIDQFTPMPLSSLACTYPLLVGNVTGVVGDFNVFPLKVEFYPNSTERQVIQDDLRGWRDALNGTSEARLEVGNIRCFAGAGEHKENRTFSLSAQKLVKLTLMVCGGKPNPNRNVYITPQQLEVLAKHVYTTNNVSELYDLNFHEFYVKFIEDLRQSNVIGHFTYQNISTVLQSLSNYSMRCGWEIDDEGSYVPVRCTVTNIVRDLSNVFYLDYENRTSSSDIILRDQEVRRLSNDALLSIEKPDELYYMSVILFGSGRSFSKLRKSWSGGSLRWKQKLDQLNRLGEIQWEVDLNDHSAPLVAKSIKVAPWLLLHNFKDISFKSISHRPHAPRFTQNFTVSTRLMTVRQPPGVEEVTPVDPETSMDDAKLAQLESRLSAIESRLDTVNAQLSFTSTRSVTTATASFVDSSQLRELANQITTLASRLSRVEQSSASLEDSVSNATAGIQARLVERDAAIESNTTASAGRLQQLLENRTSEIDHVLVLLHAQVANLTASLLLINTSAAGNDSSVNETAIPLEVALQQMRSSIDFLLKEHNSTLSAFNNHGDQISALYGGLSKLDHRVNETIAPLNAEHRLLSSRFDSINLNFSQQTHLVNSLENSCNALRSNLSVLQQTNTRLLQRVQNTEERADTFDEWQKDVYASDSEALRRIMLAEQFHSAADLCFLGNATFQLSTEADCAWKCLVNRCAAFSVVPIKTGRVINAYSCSIAHFIDRVALEIDRNCTSYITKGTAEKFGSFFRGFDLIDSNSIVTHSDRSLPDCIALCRNSPPCSAASYHSVTRTCKMTICGNVYLQANHNWNTIIIAPAKLESVDVPAVDHQWSLTETCDSASNAAIDSYGSYIVTSLGTEYRNSSSPYLPNSTYFSGFRKEGTEGDLLPPHMTIDFAWREDGNFPYAWATTIFFYAYFDTLPKKSSGNRVTLLEMRTATDKEGHIMYYTDTKHLEVELFHEAADRNAARFATSFTATKTIPIQKWLYFAISYDVSARAAAIVVDGAHLRLSAQSLANGASGLKKWSQLLIGMAAGGDMPFTGRFFCLKLFSQALDVQQIRDVAETCINGQVRVLPSAN